MKKLTYEAAKELGLHPSNLILYLTRLGASFEDSWPQVDDGWIQTLRRTYRPLHETECPTPWPVDSKVVSHHTSLPFSQSALKVLDKLYRGKNWGKHSISWRTLQNDYCPSVPDLKGAFLQLQNFGFLHSTGIGEPLSLNPSKTKEIEDLVRVFRTGGR